MIQKLQGALIRYSKSGYKWEDGFKVQGALTAKRQNWELVRQDQEWWETQFT